VAVFSWYTDNTDATVSRRFLSEQNHDNQMNRKNQDNGLTDKRLRDTIKKSHCLLSNNHIIHQNRINIIINILRTFSIRREAKQFFLWQV